tara:strand:- start:262 stop:399 length:138 start_codon:yes stop_codon:yes gene_type:complete
MEIEIKDTVHDARILRIVCGRGFCGGSRTLANDAANAPRQNNTDK